MKQRVELQPHGAKYIYEFTSRFVYTVLARDGAGENIVQGSAVAVSKKYLMTNCHVVNGAKEIVLYADKVQFKAERVESWRLANEQPHDRCLLRSDVELSVFADIRKFDEPSVGEKVYAIGAPQGISLGLTLTISEGILSGKRVDSQNRLFQTTAPISQGSSGGGLFDSSGRLIGITTFSLKAGQNLNFAIAAEDWEYDLCNAQRFWGQDLNSCDRMKRRIP